MRRASALFFYVHVFNEFIFLGIRHPISNNNNNLFTTNTTYFYYENKKYKKYNILIINLLYILCFLSSFSNGELCEGHTPP